MGDIMKKFNFKLRGNSTSSDGRECNRVNDYSITDSSEVNKSYTKFGILFLVVGLGIIILGSKNTKFDKSDYAKNALKDKVSTAISAGTILSSADENIEKKDYAVIHKSESKDTKIWVWDYAAEDGDYVQVLVNGTPIGDAFMIKHKPKEFTVPAVGEVQIKGIKDGGGGITYAIRYDINGTSYFNGTPQGEFNTYTLKKE